MEKETNEGIPVDILQVFAQNLAACPLKLEDSEAESVLDLLHAAYDDIQHEDPEEVRHGFYCLDKHLQSISLDDNDTIFSLVCQICCACEKKAFIDGARIGAHLMQEFQHG